MSAYIHTGFIGAALCLGSVIAKAQQTPPPASRWSVGASALLEHRVFVVNQQSVGSYLVGGKAYGAFALPPSLTLQAGILHGRGGSMDDDRAADGTPKYVVESYKENVVGVPVALRWQFSQPERRFQVDGLVGVSVYATRQTTTSNILRGTVSSEGWYSVTSQAKAVNGFLDLGLGFRYALSPAWQATADVMVNANMQQTGYYGIGPGASVAMGVQHRF